jgi:hypothetical protein
MTEKLSRDFVRERVIEWLKKKDYDKDLKVKWEEVGPDIGAVNDFSEEFFVETVGEANPVDRKILFLEVLGRIITRMRQQVNSKYAIALPQSYSELALNGIPWEVSEKLNLEIILVNKNGEVEEKTWEDIKEFGYVPPEHMPSVGFNWRWPS